LSNKYIKQKAIVEELSNEMKLGEINQKIFLIMQRHKRL